VWLGRCRKCTCMLRSVAFKPGSLYSYKKVFHGFMEGRLRGSSFRYKFIFRMHEYR
jgi:hypothetical protein